jgi:hypothetical protein
MSYLLYRQAEFGAPPSTRPLGEFHDFDAALAARDRDVIAQLAERPAPPREISHVIVGPGLRGPSTEHPVVTFAGAEFADTDPEGEVVAIAAWLDEIRRR